MSALLSTGRAATKVIDGTTNVEDAMIASIEPENNYGGRFDWALDGDAEYRALIRVKNVATELGVGATITACTLSAYCYQEGGDENSITAYQVLKPYVEGDEDGVDNDDGDVTWVDWASDANEWTTAGCECANDDGVDNSADDGVCDVAERRDRKATGEDTQGVNEVGWYHWDISTALAQGWYDGTIAENGIILINANNNGKNFYSTENEIGEPPKNPYWTFTYTTEVPKGNRRRKMILMQQ